MVLRGDDLGAKMSRYLVDRIEQLPNVTVHCGARVTGLEGNGHLGAGTGEAPAATCSRLRHQLALPLHRRVAQHEWLRGCVELDRNGFVVTGTALPPGTAETSAGQAAGRTPFMLETSLPGVFAAGDVRSGSVKRCASAVGEGSMAVMFVHAHLARAAA